MKWSSPTISKIKVWIFTTPIIAGTVACSSGSLSHYEEDVLSGSIVYPFFENPDLIGKDDSKEKFIIKSTVGGTEYEVQIPGAARDYDIQVPLVQFDASGGAFNDSHAAQSTPEATDRELVNALPRIDSAQGQGLAVLDKAMGLGEAEGPYSAPSYTLGLARVKDLFKKVEFEHALIELNNLILYYPNSPQLQKMKGTIYYKMQNFSLAQKAWYRAQQLDPQDAKIKKALFLVNARLGQNEISIPKSQDQQATTTSPPTEDMTSH